MEAKKNPRADVQRRYGLHLSIGFMVALALVVMAFEWRTAYEPPITFEDIDDPIPLLDEVIATDIPEPPKPKVIMPEVVPVPDEEILEEEPVIFDSEEAEKVEDIPFLTEELPDEEVDKFYEYVEKMPEPMGGMADFMAFLGKNIRYPKSGIRNDIQGKVYVQFIVDEQGNLTDLKVIKGINEDFDSESLRVLSKAPAWKPGRQGGRPVKVRMVLPIIYKLH
ncbi:MULTISPECIES: energy transducer TonB [unclassified Imperialibacter]|uniref:energy transducer TonB n=1 Tax=unclassified Imperialibacter TaxID=2629706 RepID=UPI001254244A|nr:MULTISPECIES: energy transducer TonB [unclassified Imperialibacter]CAD5270489.1 Energy transducer TonB [Imperialibacter sp. 89]CAD5298255.1 Energy transducer TonB [Imperialibacter sp. 75]VVT34839.1 Protein TonB [Imperialibacter sp. EC-SDR9]